MPCCSRNSLKDCVKLADIDESIGYLQEITLLNLKYCKSIRKLPRNIGKLKSLKTLDISFCSSLESLPKELNMIDSLKVLRADGIGCLMNLFPRSLAIFHAFEELDLSENSISCLLECVKSLPQLPKPPVSSPGNFKLEALENADQQMLKRFDLNLETMEKAVTAGPFRSYKMKMLRHRACTRKASSVHFFLETRYLAGSQKGNEEITWLSHWKFGDMLQDRDEISILVRLNSLMKVKELGIDLVCDEQELSDLSSCRVSSPVIPVFSNDKVPGDVSQRGRVFKIGS
ncbi:hypothetical protein HAX54_037510 [Datura stramonium]|uniref:Uncharacterized protein n=1 Tax=Datura stramonium TaxID=4076 RepID=A0ABS8SH24_DATST|nr:hypothetical protein [Datura stramonium]